MKTLTITITEWQYAFLVWVSKGCPKEAHQAFFAASNFIRSVRKLEAEGMIVWNTNLDNQATDSDIFQITDKGRAIFVLWKDKFQEEQ